MNISAILPSNASQPPSSLQKTSSSQTTEFQQLTQALQAALASSSQVPNGQDIFSSQQGNAAGSISRPAHHHRPHHYGGSGSELTSGFPGQTDSSGAGASGAAKTFSTVNVSA
jgi:hypothetical protein